jgi:hypothetical protein
MQALHKYFVRLNSAQLNSSMLSSSTQLNSFSMFEAFSGIIHVVSGTNSLKCQRREILRENPARGGRGGREMKVLWRPRPQGLYTRPLLSLT